VPEGGSLIVDSPACTARSAVAMLLSADFMCDQELLRCTLAEDSAYVGRNSVRLTMIWHKKPSSSDERARCSYLSRVRDAHPFLTLVCEKVMRRVL
jgi:hypothetical protein